MGSLTITITIPYPAAGLSPNARTHHQALARLKKRYRLDCGIAALAAIRAAGLDKSLPWGRAIVTPRFYNPVSRQRDRDNALAQLKAAIDALADARIVANDRDLTFGPVEFHRDPDRRVELFIEEQA